MHIVVKPGVQCGQLARVIVMLFRAWFNPFLRQAKQSAPAISEQADKVDNRVVTKNLTSYLVVSVISISFIASGRLLMLQQHLSSKWTAPGQGLNILPDCAF